MNKLIDCNNRSNIVCPHCGYEERNSWELREADFGEIMKCEDCGEWFIPEREVIINYSTSKAKMGECKHCKQHSPLTSINSSVGKYDDLCPDCGSKEYQRLCRKYMEELEKD